MPFGDFLLSRNCSEVSRFPKTRLGQNLKTSASIYSKDRWQRFSAWSADPHTTNHCGFGTYYWRSTPRSKPKSYKSEITVDSIQDDKVPQTHT